MKLQNKVGLKASKNQWKGKQIKPKTNQKMQQTIQPVVLRMQYRQVLIQSLNKL